jgi:hypothetical protein
MAVLVAVTWLATACGDGERRVTMLDGAEATPTYLAAAADRSTADAYRFEQAVDFAIPGAEADAVPLVSGEVDDGRTHVRMDLGAMFESMSSMTASLGGELPPELLSGDLTMESLVDGTVVYLRAPMFATIAAMDPTARLGPFSQLGDGWGRFDVSAFDDLVPGDVTEALAGTDTADPDALVDLVRSAEEVEDLGRSERRGDEVAGLRAELTLRDLLVAQGADTSMMLSDAFTDVVVPIEVWIDAEGYVREVEVDVDVAAVASSMGPDVPMEGFNMTTTVELFDHGDPSIEVVPPAEAVDLTGELTRLLGVSG